LPKNRGTAVPQRKFSRNRSSGDLLTQSPIPPTTGRPGQLGLMPVGVEIVILTKFAKIKLRQEALQSIFSGRPDIFYPANRLFEAKSEFQQPRPLPTTTAPPRVAIVTLAVARSSRHDANPYQAPRPLPCITRWPFPRSWRKCCLSVFRLVPVSVTISPMVTRPCSRAYSRMFTDNSGMADRTIEQFSLFRLSWPAASSAVEAAGRTRPRVASSECQF